MIEQTKTWWFCGMEQVAIWRLCQLRLIPVKGYPNMMRSHARLEPSGGTGLWPRGEKAHLYEWYCGR